MVVIRPDPQDHTAYMIILPECAAGIAEEFTMPCFTHPATVGNTSNAYGAKFTNNNGFIRI